MGYGDKEWRGSWSYAEQAQAEWGGQYYLRFRMLAWPLGEEDIPTRPVGLDVVTRKGGMVGVMLGSHG